MLFPGNLSNNYEDSVITDCVVLYTFHFHSGAFELCFIGIGNESDSPSPLWNVTAKVLRMHVYNIEAYLCTVFNLNIFLLTIDKILFMYIKKPDMSYTQQHYLIHMGKQCNCKCPVHHNMLVSCPYHSGYK